MKRITPKTSINTLMLGIKRTWKGTIFPSIFLTLGLADLNEICILAAKSGDRNLTHHIKLIDGVPADISSDEPTEEPENLSSKSMIICKTDSKEEFYKTYPNQTIILDYTDEHRMGLLDNMLKLKLKDRGLYGYPTLNQHSKTKIDREIRNHFYIIRRAMALLI